MKKNTILLISVFLTLGAYAQKSHPRENVTSCDSVVYKHHLQKLLFLPDGTYRYYRETCDICPQLTSDNLVSFGHYFKYKNKAYYLFSDMSLNTSIKRTATGTYDGSDSLTFRFHTPQPNYKERLVSDWFVYCVTLYLKPDLETLGQYVPNDTNIKAFYTDNPELKIAMPDRPIWYFTVTVFSMDPHADVNALRITYDLSDANQNVYDIDLSMATRDFFVYRRMYGQQIAILDKNAVYFNDFVLLRQGAFKAKQYTTYEPLPKKYWKYFTGEHAVYQKRLRIFESDDTDD